MVPILFIKIDIIFPNQKKKRKIENKLNYKACVQAWKENCSDILLILQNTDQEEIVSNNAKSITNFVNKVGILCNLSSKSLSRNKKDKVIEIHLSGRHRVKIKKVFWKNNCYYADYEELKDIHINLDYERELLKQIIELSGKIYNKIFYNKSAILDGDNYDIKTVNDFIYTILYSLSIRPDEIQLILEENIFEKKLEQIIVLLKKNISFKNIDKKIEKKLQDSITKAQKEFYLKEKIRIIREELGDINAKDIEVSEIKEILKTRKFPKNIEEKIKEELKKYEITSFSSAEHSVIRTYIQWLIDLPWTEYSKEEDNLLDAKTILDNDHYGLKKVKERIIEHLAVIMKKNTKQKATILCLIGPPGIGKTSLARSIARATKRNFVKISLGGIRDESEIRGHRRTYIGSIPGRIINGMKKAKTVNPLFLLDEIDKLSFDYHGDPASALLEVLDPEQNKLFSDHYIEEPYDLSKVLFVATGNSIQNIPHALFDRLEVIYLHSYTELEKILIARNYLIPKAFKNHGLKKTNVSIPKNIIKNIILHYTMEAGVRQLEREINKICRKVVVKILNQKNENLKLKINSNNIKEYLEIQKYSSSYKNMKPQPGIITGLAWTQYGGDIIIIEVTRYAGSGKLILTGNLGEIMKESANLSLAFIKTNYIKFGINKEVFEDDIHIHVPEGAVPKDGPSAGITITTALISNFKKIKISKNVAMTGEITLSGNVLEIGGLKEKLISACRNKIKIIFIPKPNIKNLIDIPDEILKKIRVYPVLNYIDVYNFLFLKNKTNTLIEDICPIFINKMENKINELVK